jgi:hypothetical protein
MALFRQVLAGVIKHWSGQTLPVNNSTITADNLATQINAIEAKVTAANAAQAAWKQLLDAADAEITAFEPLLKALHRYAEGVFGPTSKLLLDFGFTPQQTAVKTVKVKANAIDKSAATRTARHTMGKKQKAAIHGTVAEPVPTAPSPAPAVPAAPATTGGTKSS